MLAIKLSKFFVPAIIGINVYIVVNKFFPDRNYPNYLLCKNIIRDRKNLIRKIIKKIKYDKALKIALIAFFATSLVYNLVIIETFNGKIRIFFYNPCIKTKYELQISYKFRKSKELTNEINSSKSRNVFNSKLFTTDKSSGERTCIGKVKVKFKSNLNKLLLFSSIALLIAVCVLNSDEIVSFREALYRLFKEEEIPEKYFKGPRPRYRVIPVNLEPFKEFPKGA